MLRTSALPLFVTLASAAPYSFVTFGDWGTGSTLQKENAGALNAHCAQKDACSMVLGLADNFYNGPLTTEDPRWQKEFSSMYNFTSDFHTCMGNVRRDLRMRPSFFFFFNLLLNARTQTHSHAPS
jgi:hypothetical protein